jgi:energy-coupling factor transporter ATP-binding protein EcfA2
MTPATGTADAAAHLADALASARLPLALPGTAEAAHARDALVGQLHDHVLPRLADRDAPLLVVVGGSTGAGKSTLVNTLVGTEVSATGVLRPTTRAAVLVHHPDDGPAFEGTRVLPGLRRVRGDAGTDTGTLVLRADPTLSPGLALLDAPDVDSVAVENRTLARQLLAAADLWLFATTPARYADAVPWELLRTAAARGTQVAVVLARVEERDRAAVAGHLRSMLDDGGLDAAALLVVPHVDGAGALLPPAAVGEVRDHLATRAGDATARRAVADATLRGALDSLPQRVLAVRDATIAQLDALQDLHDRAEDAHATARRSVADTVDGGRVLRGEVLARWHDFVGAGDLLRWLEGSVGRLRDAVGRVLRPALPDAPLTEALGDGLVAVVVDAVERARADTARAWRAAPAGALPDDPTAAPPAVVGTARELVRAWQDEVVELVRDQAAGRRSTARAVALGLNGISAAVMVTVFASTGGLTGAEVGVAGGTSVVAQRLLEAVLGDQAVRSLADQAREALLARVDGLLATELAVHDHRLAELAVDPDLPRVLDAALERLGDARTQEGL